ncbi:transglutaminase-like putative cysteine protease [Oxalobacteraceae bacterium GrIS 2.11]
MADTTSQPAADFVACARYHVMHETEYTYQTPVTLSQQYLHLSPLNFRYQRVESELISIVPSESECIVGHDYFGNGTRHICITVPHRDLVVLSEFSVALARREGPEKLASSLPWEVLRDTILQSKNRATQEACGFLQASPHISCSAQLRDYASISYTPGRPHLDAALDLTQRIFDDFEFDDQATDISTPLDTVFTGRRGVCQDFAHLMIGCIRSLGLPARYVSGYILTHPPEGQPRMIGADASHAWVSVYCPTLGWVDFDPTNHCLVQHEHITLGIGRDFSDVTPMRGIVLGGGDQELQVKVTVTPMPLLFA